MKGAALAALALLLPLPAMADCPASGEVTAEVATVTDRATLSLADGTVVALAGVEAPARPLSLAADAPWAAGEDARNGLAAIVAGKTVSIAWASDSADRYGRRHAYVFAGSQSVQDALLGDGLLRARWYPGEDGCFAAFLAAEAPAIAARRGLWSLPEFQPRQADDSSLPGRNGLYDLVEGRVESVGHGSRMIFLDFGRNFRRDFTVMVPQTVADILAAGGRPLDTFAGKRVRVQGVIEESGGPAMRLDDAAEIEVIDDGNDGTAGR